MAARENRLQKNPRGNEMKEIFKVELKEGSVYLNGTELSEEEVTHYLKNGLKYDALKERFNFIQEAKV